MLESYTIYAETIFLEHITPLSWTHLYRELQVFALLKQFKKKKTTSSTEQAVNGKFSL